MLNQVFAAAQLWMTQAPLMWGRSLRFVRGLQLRASRPAL
jgi:hypothetical protein